jgi:desampylase
VAAPAILVAESVRQKLIIWASEFPDLEICGLIFGKQNEVQHAMLADNVASKPDDAFEIDPAALISAHRLAREGGPNLLGYFHSHPNGKAIPSEIDAKNAAPDGQLWLIIAGRGITAWRAVEHGQFHGRFDAVTILPC